MITTDTFSPNTDWHVTTYSCVFLPFSCNNSHGSNMNLLKFRFASAAVTVACDSCTHFSYNPVESSFQSLQTMFGFCY